MHSLRTVNSSSVASMFPMIEACSAIPMPMYCCMRSVMRCSVRRGDIGRHFLDSDPRYKGIDSRELLRHVAKLLREQGWLAGNVDATIIAQAPKMAPHIPAMREHIAADLGVSVESVNVKATTTEKLGFTGRGEGIAAEAVCLILKS